MNEDRRRHVRDEVFKFLGPRPMDLLSFADGISYAIEVALAWETIMMPCPHCRWVQSTKLEKLNGELVRLSVCCGVRCE